MPTTRNEDGLVALTIDRKMSEVCDNQQGVVDTLQNIIVSNKQSNMFVCVDGIRPLLDNKWTTCIILVVVVVVHYQLVSKIHSEPHQMLASFQLSCTNRFSSELSNEIFIKDPTILQTCFYTRMPLTCCTDVFISTFKPLKSIVNIQCDKNWSNIVCCNELLQAAFISASC